MITSLGLLHNDLMLTARIILINLEEENVAVVLTVVPTSSIQ